MAARGIGEVKHIRPHLLVAAILAVVLAAGWHNGLRNALADVRFAWLSQPATTDIVVVAIDAPSIEKIGVWPWPRRLHAELLRQLERAGASDIVFDVDFSTPSDPESDRLFRDALEHAGGSVVLPSFKQPGPDGTTFFNRPLVPFRAHAWSAIVNVAIEPDGLVRRYPFGQKLEGEFLPSMGAVLAGRYDKKRGPFLIDFSIHHERIPRVSFVDVLNGNPATLDRLKDKQVIIGGTAFELGDRFSIPNGGIVSGPVLQALAAESILRGRALHWTSATTTLIALASLMLAMILLWQRVSAARRVAVLAATAVAIEVSAYLLQMWFPLVLDTALLHIAVAVYIAAIGLDEIDVRDLLGRIAENRFQRIAMSLGDGLVCTDSNYLITVWNPGATTIFGYGPDEMIGRPFDTVCAANPEAGTPFSIHDAGALGTGKVIEFDARRRNGEVFPVEASFSGWQGADGFQHGAILRDISVRKREAEKIRYLAEHDTLTGLANRYTLEARLASMIAIAEAAGTEVALLIVGLDGFQHINDLLGHANGDLVLRAVSDRLTSEVGSAGVVARLSGDEFAIAISGADMSESVDHLAKRIADQLRQAGDDRQPFAPRQGFDRRRRLSGQRQQCGRTAVQRAPCALPRQGQQARRLRAVRSRDSAGDRDPADARGRACARRRARRVRAVLPATGPSRQRRFDRRGSPHSLASPGARARFLRGNSCRSSTRRRSPSALRRGYWKRLAVRRGPGSYPDSACASASTCRRRNSTPAISPRSVADVLAATGLTPSLLELEVTEDILLLDEKGVLDTFQRIQELGVRIVFDDFGTGYASLSYLKKFPLDGLKIDRSFVLDLLTDADDAAIVSSTIVLSKQLGLSVIAEGIENRATADLLATMGCEEGQGYFFGRPLPVAELERQFLSSPSMSARMLAS